MDLLLTDHYVCAYMKTGVFFISMFGKVTSFFLRRLLKKYFVMLIVLMKKKTRNYEQIEIIDESFFFLSYS